MSTDTKSMHVTRVGNNVFIDLGFESEEAAALKANSLRVIAQKLALKDALMAELARWIEARGLTQAEAAEILGCDSSPCFRCSA
jgi:predicted XRE-type DNA-binding protein